MFNIVRNVGTDMEKKNKDILLLPKRRWKIENYIDIE